MYLYEYLPNRTVGHSWIYQLYRVLETAIPTFDMHFICRKRGLVLVFNRYDLKCCLHLKKYYILIYLYLPNRTVDLTIIQGIRNCAISTVYMHFLGSLKEFKLVTIEFCLF